MGAEPEVRGREAGRQAGGGGVVGRGEMTGLEGSPATFQENELREGGRERETGAGWGRKEGEGQDLRERTGDG